MYSTLPLWFCSFLGLCQVIGITGVIYFGGQALLHKRLRYTSTALFCLTLLIWSARCGQHHNVIIPGMAK